MYKYQFEFQRFTYVEPTKKKKLNLIFDFVESEKLKLESNRVYKFQFELGERERPVGCRSHSLERVNEMVTSLKRFAFLCFVLFFRLCFCFWSGAGVV